MYRKQLTELSAFTCATHFQLHGELTAQRILTCRKEIQIVC